ncbi:IS3 family transposase [Enterococcus durans]|uniref:IS3 family transposase n=1 Tax=Enterococcus TaxID=1350 RepID=UPI00115C5D54|nr:IS3 family transposase [Enterococcus durans]NHB75022.1 IS3 family transposase [Enterococcus faecium]
MLVSTKSCLRFDTNTKFKEITKNYVDWFNNRRISQKTKGMTPCEYREHALAV